MWKLKFGLNFSSPFRICVPFSLSTSTQLGAHSLEFTSALLKKIQTPAGKNLSFDISRGGSEQTESARSNKFWAYSNDERSDLFILGIGGAGLPLAFCHFVPSEREFRFLLGALFPSEFDASASSFTQLMGCVSGDAKRREILECTELPQRRHYYSHVTEITKL